MDEDRKKIIARVAKLLNMTSSNGASEQEAIVAAEKAAALMTEYNINMTELSLKGAKAIPKTADSTIYHNNWKLGDHEIARPIARLCDCIYWHNAKTIKYTFFGLPLDAEYAMFLYEMLSNTIAVELEIYKATSEFKYAAVSTNKISLYRAFIRGMQTRLAQRINQLAQEKEDAVARAATTGTALVVLKQEIVINELKQAGVKLRNTKVTHRDIKSDEAFRAGKAAADRIDIGKKGIHSTDKKQIG